jgi:hypothetical protein
MNQSGQFDVAVQKNVNDEEPANAAAKSFLLNCAKIKGASANGTGIRASRKFGLAVNLQSLK